MGDESSARPEPEHGAGQGDIHPDVIELALGNVDAERRARVAAHLLVCRSCRDEYDEVASTLGELLPAVPAIQPPLGFDEHVLHRLGVPETRRPRRTGFVPALAAVAAALVVLVGGVGWWAMARDDGATDVVRPLELADGGGQVGTVSIGDVDGEPVMVVALVAAREGVSYRCRTTFADGSTTEAAAWPAGNGAWVVPLPQGGRSDIAVVDLVVDGTDEVWSSASFGDVAS